MRLTIRSTDTLRELFLEWQSDITDAERALRTTSLRLACTKLTHFRHVRLTLLAYNIAI